MELKKRKRIEGISGILHEINIIAHKGNIIIAVECKNDTILVSIKEIRDFKSKLDDLPLISKVFVTNSKFIEESINYANHYNIRLRNGENLSKIHYLSSIGRLKENINIPIIKKENGYDESEIVVDNALPVSKLYGTIKKLSWLILD